MSAPKPSSTPGRLLRPFQEFFRLEASGGIVLLLCAAAAMVWANSPAAASYVRCLEAPLTSWP